MSANGAAASNMAAAQGGGTGGMASMFPQATNTSLPNVSPESFGQITNNQAPSQLNLGAVQGGDPALQNQFTPASIAGSQSLSPQAAALLSQSFNNGSSGNPLGAFSQAVGGLGQYMPTTMPTLTALPSNAATQLTSGWQGQFTPPPVQSNVMSQAPVAPPPAAAAAPPPVAVATNGWPAGMTPIPGWTYAQYQAALNSGNQQAQQVALYSEANQSPSGGGNNGGN